jgi:hypothetical protein
MQITYLMSPYTHNKREIMRKRYEQAIKVVYALTAENRLIFSPVVYCHPIALTCKIAPEYHLWKTFNTKMVSISDEGIVLQLKGWIDSVGIRHELDLFRKAKKSIYYITPKELGLEEE